MSIKTKLITYPTLAILAVVAAIGFQANNSDDNYVLSVKWSPPAMPQHNEVTIVISVDGFPLPPIRRRLSPWGETMTAAPGAIVKLRATANHPVTELLDCIIMRNGRSVGGGGYDKRTGAGFVECVG